MAVCGSSPSTCDVTGAARAEALQDLDGGRLAGPVGAEEGEDLAVRDLEVETADRLDVAVAHVQALDGDGGVALVCCRERARLDVVVENVHVVHPRSAPAPCRRRSGGTRVEIAGRSLHPRLHPGADDAQGRVA